MISRVYTTVTHVVAPNGTKIELDAPAVIPRFLMFVPTDEPNPTSRMRVAATIVGKMYREVDNEAAT